MPCPDYDMLAAWAFNTVSAGSLPDESGLLTEHLKTCPACAQEYNRWYQIAQSWQVGTADGPGLADCPTENAMAEYLDGVLPADTRNQLEAHLAGCSHCVRQLAETHSLLTEVSRSTSVGRIALEWLQEGVRSIQSSLEAFRPVPLTTAPVLRGGSPIDALRWELEHGALLLQVTAQRASSEHLTLHLALTRSSEPEKDFRIAIRTGGVLLESRRANDNGTAVFFSLPAANYDIEVSACDEPFHFAIEIPHA